MNWDGLWRPSEIWYLKVTQKWHNTSEKNNLLNDELDNS